MSALGELEAGVVAALAGLEGSGGSLLATVRAATPADRKVLTAELARERMPAAHVVLDGVEAGKSDGGAVVMRVLVATRSHRDAGESRVGGPEGVGLLAVCDAISAALSGALIGGAFRLEPLDESFSAGTDGMALGALSFRAASTGAIQAVTFAGSAPAGAASEVRVERGSLRRAVSVFAFPGVDGGFGQDGGMSERVLAWSGRLRATDEMALSGLEAAMEAMLGSGPGEMVDETGRAYADCAARAFERVGARRRDAWTGEVVQGFRMEFVQLGSGT